MHKIVATIKRHSYLLIAVGMMSTMSATAFGTATLIEQQQSYYAPGVQTIRELGYMVTAGIGILTIIYVTQIWAHRRQNRHRQQQPENTNQTTRKKPNMAHRINRKLLWEPKEELSTSEVVATLIPMLEQENLIGDADTNQKDDVLNLITGQCDQEWDQAIFHVATLSEQWTDFTFIMDCLDEDGQLWREFYRNGKAYLEYYHPPEFDQDHYREFAKPPTA